MSLNTVENNKYPQRAPGDSRSLRTDDIIGAKPKNSIVRSPEPEVYGGLNLPSYSKPQQKSPLVQNDYSKNLAKFYGSTPENNIQRQYISPSKPVSNEIDPDVAAKFFGATPPRSRSIDPLSSNKLPQSEIAKFYGVTPLQSRGGKFGVNSGLGQASGIPEKELANFFGVTPKQTGFRGKQEGMFSSDIPKKDIEKFFGVTPEQTGYKGSSPNNLGKGGVPDKALAAFFGTSPPGTSEFNRNSNKSDLAKAGSQVLDIPPKALSGFFGSTPQNTGYPNKYQNPSSPTYANAYNKSPNQDFNTKGKFGGIPLSASPYKQNPVVSPKALANFYGVTPPLTSNSPLPNSNSKSSLSKKEIANFYGVTPPPTGKGQNSLDPKVVANFYGVTPPPSGNQGFPSKGKDVFSENAGKFFGSDSVSPEFQYAANIATKPVFNPYARHKNNHDNTASRIFN